MPLEALVDCCIFHSDLVSLLGFAADGAENTFREINLETLISRC